MGTSELGHRSKSPYAVADSPRYRPLLWRVVAINGTVLLATVVIAVWILTPSSVARLAPEEAVLLGLSLVALIVGNLLLLRRELLPLQRLARLTQEVDPARPGQRVPIEGHHSEATELARAFNQMLARLEAERRESTRRVLAAQESERLRIARELHDEVGQTLTAVLLQLQRTSKRVGEPTRSELVEAQNTARAGLDDVRRIAVELRPEALEELGLAAALNVLCERLTGRTGLKIECDIAHDLPPIAAERELVIYRIAQEALTNVVRHAHASSAELRLQQRPEGVSRSVHDDGTGFSAPDAREGTGLRGMRERALLIGADLQVNARTRNGVTVQLDVPADGMAA